MVSRQLARYRERRQYALDFLGGVCVVCGSIKDLEIDHIIKADKAFPITQMWSVSQERYDLELLKCQLLCHEHHVEKSHREKDWGTGFGPSEHGGSSALYKKGCRCRPCKDYYNSMTNRYRINKKIDAILAEPD